MNKPPKPFAIPGLALAVGYVAAVLLPLAFAAVSGLPPADAWGEAAAATGFAGGAMMLLQFGSSGRYEALSGRIGIDVTMAFHKWVAPVALALVLLHPVLLAGPIDPANPGAALRRLWNMMVLPQYREGVLATGLMLVLVVLALARDRLPVSYEVWRLTHAVLAVAVVVLSVAHILDAGYYSEAGPGRAYWPALAVLVLVPLVAVQTRKWRSLRSHDWRVASVSPVAESQWEVVLESGTGKALPFRAGQFAWIAAMSDRLPIYFDHPFSIASGPGDGRKLRFIVKEAGDFTAQICDLPAGRRVGIDAPHGSFTTDAAGGDALLLVAGGVGIAPIIGILEDLAARGDTRPVRVIYATRSEASMISGPLLDAPLAALDARLIRISGREGSADSAGMRRGRIDREVLREAMEGLDPARTGALICGPGPMMAAVTDLLHAFGLPLSAIHYERFDYGDTARSVKDRRIVNVFRVSGLAILAGILAFTFR